jgi:predicted transglutaminase-like cysteine proteinase
VFRIKREETVSIRDKTITFGIPMLAPVGWVEFAERNPDQAELSIGIVQDSDDVMNLLCDVNDDVNEKISPKLDAPEQDWNIWPRSGYGDCTDYTVTKRAELMSKGLPSSSLLIAEVVTPEEEPHAILVVRTVGGDYVLDNRDPMIYLWNEVGYWYVKMQTPENPNFWKSVDE